MELKKIAIVDPLGGHGSSHHHYLFGQALGLEKLDVQVYIYTCDETSLKFQKGFVKLYYRKIYSQAAKWLLGLRYLQGTLMSLLDILKNKIYSVHLHFFQVGILEFINVFLFKIIFRNVVVTIHDVEGFSKDNFFLRKIIYNLIDTLIVHNNYSKQQLLTQNSSLIQKIKVISHGHYLPFLQDDISRNEARKKLDIELDKKVILFFGMIKDVKGLDVLLKALPKIILKEQNIRLLIAGKSWKTDFKKYQKLINDFKIQDYCIIHHRFIPEKEVSTYYAASDLAVLPYKKIYQSGVLLMSMSYQIPVLVSDLPPMQEVVEDLITGYVFKSENVEDLAEKTASALSSKTKLQEVKNAALNKLRSDYDWEEIAKKLINIYS